MGGWKTKFVFLLMVYFAGFATAVHMLVPTPENQAGQSYENTGQSYENAGQSSTSSFNSQEFAESFKTGMHKCAIVAKDVALHISSLIKQKMEERKLKNQQIADSGF